MSDGTLDYSQISEFLACRHRWYLKYRRGIRPRTSARPLQLGSAVHAGLAAHAIGECPDQAIVSWASNYAENRDLTREEIFELEDIVSTGRAITERVINFLGDEWETVYLDGVPLVEQELHVEVPGWPGYHGTLDRVARERRTGSIWIFDYKVRGQFLPDYAEETNLQLGSYQYLLHKHGIETAGTICLQIRNSVPSKPKLNKNGTMARSAIATDWETYRAALLEAGLNPADYEDMREKLDTEWFRLSRAYRTKLEVQRLWFQVVVPVALEMAKITSPLEVYRNLGRGCGYCSYRDLCLEDLRGRDIGDLIGTQYIIGSENDSDERLTAAVGE